jgi:hypothetical protein
MIIALLSLNLINQTNCHEVKRNGGIPLFFENLLTWGRDQGCPVKNLQKFLTVLSTVIPVIDRHYGRLLAGTQLQNFLIQIMPIGIVSRVFRMIRGIF